MKRFCILLMALCLHVFAAHAQISNLQQLKKEDRNAYLFKISKEVVMNFSPLYYREYRDPEVSELQVFQDTDNRPQVQRHVGRRYYIVTIPHDPTKDFFAWNYAAKVYIWEEDGEPQGVIFGNGMGVNFFFRSYREWVEEGVKESERILYQESEIMRRIYEQKRGKSLSDSLSLP